MLFEKGIKGGITQAVKRYVRANKKYMKDQYNPDKPSTLFQYLDANNIFGLLMIQKLPFGFDWEKIDDFTLEKKHEREKKDT